MFQDEARFGRINQARRCWAPRGLRPEVPVQIVREYTYLLGATSPHDGVLDTLILPEVNAEAMSLFLAEVAERHRQDYILMVLDGAGFEIYLGEQKEKGQSMEAVKERDTVPHMQNFLKAVKSRNYKDLNGDVEEGVTSADLVHMANISYRLGRKLTFEHA